MNNEKPWWEEEITSLNYEEAKTRYSWIRKQRDVSTTVESKIYVWHEIGEDVLLNFIKQVDQRAREEAIKEFAERVVGEIKKTKAESSIDEEDVHKFGLPSYVETHNKALSIAISIIKKEGGI